MDISDRKLKLTPKRIEQLQALGIRTAEDLLSYYPFRYEILNARPQSEWRSGDKVTFEAEVISAARTVRFGRNRTMTKFDVLADDNLFHVTIFNRPWAKQLKMNEIITISGVYKGNNNVTAISYQARSMAELEPIQPQYSTRSGIQQRTIRDCVRKVLTTLYDSLEEHVPADYINAYRLLPRREALMKIHFPQREEDIKAAARTLKYEEFLRFFLAVRKIRSEADLTGAKEPRMFPYEAVSAWVDSLPFEMTPDQQKALHEILEDMRSSRLMYRLVQGDVGCGKTVVAAGALYATVLSGYQGALLAPTEILARQHYDNFRELFRNTKMRIGVLYSGMKPAEQAYVLQQLEAGEIDLLIGTHSLIQERVHFPHLGLVVADEQQRFGVAQRRALREKGTRVDFLLMSATPIPRTLANTLYGDMDISTIETMPKGRKQVITELIKENSFRSILNDVNGLLASGRQLYVICAAVEDSEEYDARNVHDVAAALQKYYAGQYKVGILHGRMSSEEKQEVMRQFLENRMQILVSTTVVEVGVNVVNATGMIIYDADRFGLAQIHQLRGRVQRGREQGYCWLLTGSTDEKTMERLNVLVSTSDGFAISYEDLRLRGPGDILGTKQSGLPDFVLGNIIEDQKIINQARKDAETILQHADLPQYQRILQLVEAANADNAQFVD